MMKLSLKKLFIFLPFVWLSCHAPYLSFAQNQKQHQNVSVNVVNEPVSRVLDRISRNTGISFSYNPDHIDASRLVTLNLKDKTIEEVLTTILPADKFGFRFTGNQVVVYRNSVINDKQTSQSELAVKSGPFQIVQSPPDTVFLTRTNIVRDTVALTDTLVKFDTVYIMRTITREKPIEGNDIFSDLINLGKEQTSKFKFEPGVSLNWLFAEPFYSAPSEYHSKLEDYKAFNSGSLLSGTLSVDARLSYARFTLSTAISYSLFNGELDYRYEISTGGVFRKDTLDKYYTLQGVDTSWYYVLDSTYLPINRQAFGNKSPVNHRYFEVPFTLQYHHPLGNNLIYIKGGVIAGFHAGSNGYLILQDKEGVIEMSEVKFKPLVFSYTIGAGILFPLSTKLTLDAGVNYREHLDTILDDFAIDFRTRAFGVRAGLIYKL